MAGCDPKDVAENKKLVQTFVFCHEFGHALDFKDNFLGEQYKRLGNKYGRNTDLVALRLAFLEQSNYRFEDMSRLLNGSLKRPDVKANASSIWGVMDARLEALGIDTNNPSELKIAQGVSYRHTRSETTADSFALAYIMQNQKDFFYDPKTGELANGRVARYGGEMEIPEQLLPALNLNPGTPIEGVYTSNGKSRKYSGFLNTRIRRGANFTFKEGGDSRQGDILSSSSPVKKVTFKSGAGYNLFGVYMDNGSNMRFAVFDDKQEAPDINISGEELSKELGLHIGSELAMLKVNMNKYSKISPAGLIQGYLDNELKVGNAIYLTTKGMVNPGANPKAQYSSSSLDNIGNKTSVVSNVKRFYRKWNQYFAETDTSVYEILPLK